MKTKVGNLSIDFTGVPYIIGKTIIKGCKHGPDRHVKEKERLALKRRKVGLVLCVSMWLIISNTSLKLASGLTQQKFMVDN